MWLNLNDESASGAAEFIIDWSRLSWYGEMQCQVKWCYHNLDVIVPKTLQTTGERIVTPINGHISASAARQSRQTVFMTCVLGWHQSKT